MSFSIAENGEEALRPNAEYRGHIYNNVLETIGATPLVRVQKFVDKYSLEADILTKLEFFNPLSSVKDRIGFAMIEDAERYISTPLFDSLD